MAEAHWKTDVVIAAAGALTLAEQAMFGLPSLLVPLAAAARGHQIANAKVYTERAGGIWVAEPSWDTESSAVRVAATLTDFDAASVQSQRLREMARPNAAQELVEEGEALVAGH